MHPTVGDGHVGRPFQRRECPADHVAGVLQFITPTAAIALVLGANLGSAINPMVEGASRDNPESYRLPVGNLFNRLLGVAVVLPFLHP